MIINLGKPLRAYISKDIFWMRVYKWGVVGKNLSIHPLFFSERSGMVKRFELFGWSFKMLEK